VRELDQLNPLSEVFMTRMVPEVAEALRKSEKGWSPQLRRESAWRSENNTLSPNNSLHQN
jgi:hypothetical protein